MPCCRVYDHDFRKKIVRDKGNMTNFVIIGPGDRAKQCQILMSLICYDMIAAKTAGIILSAYANMFY